MTIEQDLIEEVGRVDHSDLVRDSECLYDWGCDDYYWYASLRRSIYIEDNLFSISNYGLKVNDLYDPAEELTELLFFPRHRLLRAHQSILQRLEFALIGIA